MHAVARRFLRFGAVLGAIGVAGALTLAGTSFACTSNALIQISPSSGPTGVPVAVTGQSFSTVPGAAPVTLRWDHLSAAVVWSGQADASGNIQTSLVVPQLSPGYHILIAEQAGANGQPLGVLRAQYAVSAGTSAALVTTPLASGSGGDSVANQPVVQPPSQQPAVTPPVALAAREPASSPTPAPSRTTSQAPAVATPIAPIAAVLVSPVTGAMSGTSPGPGQAISSTLSRGPHTPGGPGSSGNLTPGAPVQVALNPIPDAANLAGSVVARPTARAGASSPGAGAAHARRAPSSFDLQPATSAGSAGFTLAIALGTTGMGLFVTAMALVLVIRRRRAARPESVLARP